MLYVLRAINEDISPNIQQRHMQLNRAFHRICVLYGDIIIWYTTSAFW